VKDTPNYKQNKTIIPGVYGRAFEEEVRLKYGVDSDEYRVRVEGGISQKGAEGAYYGSKINELWKKNRITDDLELNPNYPVYIVLDPGYTTAVGFWQQIEQWIHVIDYYEDSGLGVEKYVDIFEDRYKNLGYRYKTIFVPCDMDSNATRVITGQSTLETLQGFMYNTETLKREHRVTEGIKRTFKFLDRCRFNSVRCRRLIECLEGYCEKKNKAMSTEDRPVFTGVPEKNGTEHGADMFRYMSMAAPSISSDTIMTAEEARAIWARRRR
jgi:hypothetical protein